MHTAAAIAAQEVDHTDPVEKKVQDLIRRFNDPDGFFRSPELRCQVQE